MRERRILQGKRAGSALITILIVTTALCAVLGVTVQMGSQRAFQAARLSDQIRAKAIAEAGVAEAFSRLAVDWPARTNADSFPLTDYAGGAFDVAVSVIDDYSAVICSTGTFQGVMDVAILDVRLFLNGTAVDTNGAYDCCIVAEEEVTWTGCGVFSEGGRVHGNLDFKQAGCGELNTTISSSTEITLLGNSGFVDGDAYAPKVKGKTSKVYGTVYEQPVPELKIPEIDLAPYYQQALANGEVYNGKLTVSHAFAPVGGVCWVNGDLWLVGSEDIEGCFIATGDIKCSGSGGHTKVAKLPALISRDGDIHITGGATYYGMVYARIGNIDITGGCQVYGQLMCGGDFTKHGASAIFSYAKSVPVAPGEPESEGSLAAMAWQR